MRTLTLALTAGVLVLALASSIQSASVTTPPGPSTTDDCARMNAEFGNQPPRCVMIDGHLSGSTTLGTYYAYVLASQVPGSNHCLASAAGVGAPHFGLWQESNGAPGLQTKTTFDSGGGTRAPDTPLVAPCGPWRNP